MWCPQVIPHTDAAATPTTLAEAAAAVAQEVPTVEAAIAANIVETQVEYVAEAWRRREEEGFKTERELGEAMTDLATVRDAMEANLACRRRMNS